MNKRHRIFIAINLPGDIKKELAKYQKKWLQLPAKWTSEDNLHITLLFLGDVTNEELGDICIAAKEVASRYESVDVTLDRVGYGPDNKIPPRMVWASGEKSGELSALKRDLEDSLEGKVNLLPDFKIFSPHVTMARISTFAWRTIEPEERPEINENISLTFTAESIEVMESKLHRGGPAHTIIESLLLR